MIVEIEKDVLDSILKLSRIKLIFSGDEDKVQSGCIEEVCGILIGKKKKGKILIDEVKKVENVANSRFLFEISPYDLYNAYIYAQKMNKDVIGIFHSHPHGSANPSSLDAKGIKETGLVWMIVGKDDVKAFLYDDKLNKIIELKIKVK